MENKKQQSKRTTNGEPEFLVFLQIYAPTDYAKLNRENISDAEIIAIMNRHKNKFSAWSKIPESIRRYYPNQKVPEKVLVAASRDPNFTIEDLKKVEKGRFDNVEDSSDSQMILKTLRPKSDIKLFDGKKIRMTFHQLALAGVIAHRLKRQTEYSQSALKTIAKVNALLRTDYIESLVQKGYSPEEISKISQGLHGLKLKTMQEDLVKTQPERAAVRLLNRYDAHKIDKETFLPQLDVLLKRVQQQGREKELAKLMKGGKYIACSEDAKQLFTEIMKSQNMISDYENQNNGRDLAALRGTSQNKAKTAVRNLRQKVSRRIEQAYASKLNTRG